MTRVTGQLRLVRFGGVQTADGYQFEVSGGHLCLDFANTLDERKTDHARELLRAYGDLVAWGSQAGAITVPEAAALRRQAGRRPRAAATALARGRVLREAIFQVFDQTATGKPAPARCLALLEDAIAHFAPMRRLRQTGGAFSWHWRGETTDLERVLWPVAWSAGELLTSPDLHRVRQCAGAGCAWLFLDTTKSGTRRWCDMSVCGNRAKARRHYRKVSREVDSRQ